MEDSGTAPRAAPGVGGWAAMASVLITGASRGIGRAIALRLDRSGFDVIAGVRCEDDGRRLVAVASDRLRVMRLDVTEGASVRVAAGVAGERLDALVNNAGI